MMKNKKAISNWLWYILIGLMGIMIILGIYFLISGKSLTDIFNFSGDSENSIGQSKSGKDFFGNKNSDDEGDENDENDDNKEGDNDTSSNPIIAPPTLPS